MLPYNLIRVVQYDARICYEISYLSYLCVLLVRISATVCKSISYVDGHCTEDRPILGVVIHLFDQKRKIRHRFDKHEQLVDDVDRLI